MSQLSRLSGLKTPKTEPRPDRGEMHPQLLHQTTAKEPDSGLKLGFVDPPPHPPHTVASAQNTPSRTRTSNTKLSSTTFDFNFGSESALSNEAQKMMDSVREETARIKAQMQAEKEAQKYKDCEAEAIFDGINAAGRKIAKPKGKAGRFSDIHMAQFKKMDSIANHPSAFRSKRPGFAQPTTQSLKRSGSKAGLDEVDRPRTAGKGTPGRKPPPFLGRPTSVSPFKSVPQQPDRAEEPAQVKRARHSELHDVSASRASERAHTARPVNHPTSVSSHLLSPTKASLARAANSQIPVASPKKTPGLTRTTSMKSLRATLAAPSARPSTSHGAASNQTSTKIPQFQLSLERPLPPLPNEICSSPQLALEEPSKSIPSLPAPTSSSSFASRLPKLSGLKSILRSPRKSDNPTLTKKASATPKRPSTATATSATGSTKRVDFTPSVKSRYAVKLAAGSPSPAKLPQQLTPGHALAPAIPYDAAAYTIDDEDGWEDAEDASSEIEYPVLSATSSSPGGPVKVDKSFINKAKEHTRRESKEFKSIFTTLHHPSRTSAASTLTSIDTTVHKNHSPAHANKVMRSPSYINFSNPSPSTIRRVRTSGVTSVVQPFEDTDVKTMPHGLPGKKRRRASEDQEDTDGESGKENRRTSFMPSVPGGWRDSMHDDDEEQDEGGKRGGKRLRTAPSHEKISDVAADTTSPVKKPRQSSARELAKQSAKERKGGRLMSLSRLNFLSQPKQRG
ncbi:hypothetical protein A1O7_00624 [Cladophialophora yegresii CBS 114405]|uniref:Erythromycin esterase n=1 Tax=Cladophialophora yegresii CBS 114405 TaxID=1182544 RepID=W9W8I4_9EURO|nr:uncharacterized protein A1O7_00624 [Cladophialophora yegresii CBS 114405]EXJ64288.1 hypothetical protein A1O7_00624 [Cladophialophora yegresii CBS 114405]